jgi:nucleoside 2-deoxyribosyltransferase
MAHPFDIRYEMRKWELNVEKEIHINIFNPFYDAIERTDVEKIDSGRMARYEKLNCVELVERDVKNIRLSDELLAIVDGSLSYGTIQEMVYAHRMKIPVKTVITNGHEDHPWLKYHSNIIYTSLDSFVIALKQQLEQYRME